MTNFSEFSDPDFEEGWGTPVKTPAARDQQRAEIRAAVLREAADHFEQTAGDMTRFRGSQIATELRRMADEETSR
jgi:hypothetical protein